jgi:hypothetical protein
VRARPRASSCLSVSDRLAIGWNNHVIPDRHLFLEHDLEKRVDLLLALLSRPLRRPLPCSLLPPLLLEPLPVGEVELLAPGVHVVLDEPGGGATYEYHGHSVRLLWQS